MKQSDLFWQCIGSWLIRNRSAASQSWTVLGSLAAASLDLKLSSLASLAFLDIMGRCWLQEAVKAAGCKGTESIYRNGRPIFQSAGRYYSRRTYVLRRISRKIYVETGSKV